MRSHPREDEEHGHRHKQFQDHVLGDPEPARLHCKEALQFAERLGNQDFPIHRVIEGSNIGDLGAAGTQELRHFFK